MEKIDVQSKIKVFFLIFQVFLLVVLFGLFHGLIFLPVLSSFIGPAPYKTSSNKIENDEVKKWQEIKFISGKLSYNYLSMTTGLQG